MRKRQYVIFAESVGYSESKFVVITLSEERVGSDIIQNIVHPTHVPLEIETQSAHGRRHRYHRECRGFLRHSERPRETRQNRPVHVLKERDRLQVIVAAVFVGAPFAALTVIVQIQHARHGVETQSVDMVKLYPVSRTRDQERPDGTLAVVEHHRPPRFMLGFQRVVVFVRRGTVETVQPEFVLREMRQHEVEDDADALGMKAVHQIHEVVRRAEPRSRREKVAHLISPAHFERVFGNGHKFDVSVPHVLDVTHQPVRHFAVRKRVAVLVTRPRTQMDFVYIHRLIDTVSAVLGFHIRGVGPPETLYIE